MQCTYFVAALVPALLIEPLLVPSAGPARHERRPTSMLVLRKRFLSHREASEASGESWRAGKMLNVSKTWTASQIAFELASGLSWAQQAQHRVLRGSMEGRASLLYTPCPFSAECRVIIPSGKVHSTTHTIKVRQCGSPRPLALDPRPYHQ